MKGRFSFFFTCESVEVKVDTANQLKGMNKSGNCLISLSFLIQYICPKTIISVSTRLWATSGCKHLNKAISV